MEYAIVTGITSGINAVIELLIIVFKWFMGGLFVSCLLCMFLDGEKFKKNKDDFYTISNRKGIK